jgi:sRNA-binding protein
MQTEIHPDVAPHDGTAASTVAAPGSFAKGIKALWQYWPRMRAAFPTAFPLRREDVRPLARGAAAALAAALSVDVQFASGLVKRWKLRRRYCLAVLRHDVRLKLDGTPTAEAVTNYDRTQAQHQLWQLNQRRKRRRAAKALAAAQLRNAQPAASNTSQTERPGAHEA